jgi:hypothetical protein
MKSSDPIQQQTVATKPDKDLRAILKSSDKKVKDIFEKHDPGRHPAQSPPERRAT